MPCEIFRDEDYSATKKVRNLCFVNIVVKNVLTIKIEAGLQKDICVNSTVGFINL